MPVDFGIDPVTTARLVGRRPEPADAATYARIFTDARVDEAAWPEHLRTADRAHALLDDEVLKLDSVVAQTVEVNHASRAVMEKLGMSHERDVVHAGLPHVLYRSSR